MLVSVIWLVAVVALLGAMAAVAVRLNVKLAANIVEAARAEALADGAVRLVAFEVAVGEEGAAAGRGYDLAGRPVFCSLTDEFRARIAVQDQRGLVDLNGAPRELLERLFGAAGFDARRAGRLAAAAVDFRDEDERPLPEGAEEEAYRQAGLDYGPKNAAFEAAEELDQVPGFEAGEIGRLIPYLTVYSQQSEPEPAVAPEALQAMLRMRRPREQPGEAEAQAQAGERSGRTFAVDVTVGTGEGSGFRRRAFVVAAGRPDRPFAILDWRQAVEPLDHADRRAMRTARAPCFGQPLFSRPAALSRP